MDHQSTLAAPACQEKIEQAVFTSLRSPMARGYRIVASSSGLLEDEKREIVQRAPSHGNLCDDSAGACAQAAFLLRSGRHCLMFARHAGPEPSGRGGLRVHTHALVLTGSLYRQLGCDPSRVEGLVVPPETESAPTICVPALEAISLAAGQQAAAAPTDAEALETASVSDVLAVVFAVLEERRIIVVGAPEPPALVQAVFAATPLGLRHELCFAYGMRFSTQRGFRLLFHEESTRELELIASDHAYSIVECGSQTQLGSTPFAPWLSLVRDEWKHGRWQQLRALADRLDSEFSPDALARVAALTADVRTVESLDADGLEALRARWQGVEPGGPVQRGLLERIERLAAARLADIAEAEADEAEGGECPP